MADTSDTSSAKFAFKEVVFAKVRGYVPWPAIIDGVRGDAKNRKYDVFFYGTNQLGACKEDELMPYMDNRATLGRPKKNIKFFDKAVQEADDVLGLVCQNDFESANESGSSKIGKKRGRARSKSARSRSVSPAAFDTLAKRGRPRTRSSSRSKGEEEGLPEVVKRGRGRPRTRNKSMPRIGPESTLVEQSEMPGPSTSVAKSNTDEPQTTGRARRPRSVPRTPSGECFDTKPSLKGYQCIINPDVDTPWEKRQAFTFLCNEIALNEAIFGIQGCLSLVEKPNLELASNHIDQFFGIELSPLMLKKHPEAVETFEKLQYYCGNLEKWNLSDSAKSNCQFKMKIINEKARLIYDKFKNLFKVPEGKSFEEFFKEEVRLFSKVTQGISAETIWKMTKDLL